MFASMKRPELRNVAVFILGKNNPISIHFTYVAAATANRARSLVNPCNNIFATLQYRRDKIAISTYSVSKKNSAPN